MSPGYSGSYLLFHEINLLEDVQVHDLAKGGWSSSYSAACVARVGSHLRTPALKAKNFSLKSGHFSKTQKWIY